MSKPEIDIHILKRLNDILSSAKRILLAIQNETAESFVNSSSMDVQDIVARRFTIIGEASAALLKKHPEFCKEHPEIPLHQARGMRNLLVHDYDGVDWEWVWDTCPKNIPTLIGTIKPFLADMNEGQE